MRLPSKLTKEFLNKDAIELSKKTHQKSFPDNKIPQDTYIFKFMDLDANHLGYVWFKIQDNYGQKYAFIYDFHLFEEFRGLGLSKKLLAKTEDEIRRLGIKSVGLHVFGQNEVAINLYKKSGFSPTNIIMRKELP